MSPPTTGDITRHQRALAQILAKGKASGRQATEDLTLLFESRGMTRSESERIIDEALQQRPRVAACRRVSIGGHQERSTIVQRNGTTEIEVDSVVVAVLGPAATQKDQDQALHAA